MSSTPPPSEILEVPCTPPRFVSTRNAYSENTSSNTPIETPTGTPTCTPKKPRFEDDISSTTKKRGAFSDSKVRRDGSISVMSFSADSNRKRAEQKSGKKMLHRHIFYAKKFFLALIMNFVSYCDMDFGSYYGFEAIFTKRVERTLPNGDTQHLTIVEMDEHLQAKPEDGPKYARLFIQALLKLNKVLVEKGFFPQMDAKPENSMALVADDGSLVDVMIIDITTVKREIEGKKQSHADWYEDATSTEYLVGYEEDPTRYARTILLAKKLLENPEVLISKVQANMEGKDFGLRDHPIFEEVENLPDNDPAVVEMVQQFPMMI